MLAMTMYAGNLSSMNLSFAAAPGCPCMCTRFKWQYKHHTPLDNLQPSLQNTQHVALHIGIECIERHSAHAPHYATIEGLARESHVVNAM